jgi:pimeloyl-ACP methyl ester carboxylesterase
MRLSIDGHPVELDVLGHGRPVLMLHGFPLDRRALLRAVDPVFARRSGYRRIHVDLPGFGASPRVPGIDGSAAMVDFVLRLIEEVASDAPLLLVGESWGAYLARAVIARRPHQVAGAALLVPMTVVSSADRDLPPHRVLYEEPGVLAGAPDAHAAAIRGVGVVIDTPSWSYFRSVIAPALGAGDAEAIAAIARDYGIPMDGDATAEPFEGPALIVTGRQDSMVGYRDALGILERFPRATYAVLDGAGHNVSGERPALLAALLDDWLDRVERLPGWVARERGVSEAEVIRESIRQTVAGERVRPRPGLFAGRQPIAREVDANLRGFGER